MKIGVYLKLAFDGIRKNKRLYLPYMLTQIGIVMMYYIIMFLQLTKRLSGVTGEQVVRSVLGFGSWIIAAFACIFLFYTNSFLLRRRKKEFGLYNILGMEKRHIVLVFLWESLMINTCSLLTGLFCGLAFSKLAELGLLRILRAEIDYRLFVSLDAVFMTVIVFTVIFVLLFFNALLQLRGATAIKLLRSENVGEKAPRGNWFFGLAGILLLAFAYYLAVSVANPISALGWFFVAVLLVIVGTYLVMIAGSVLFCRLLQRNKKYYYRANHFISVSSMVYRMKRNGAGLASICILATMVLVMISSTTSLYFGAEDALKSRYPSEFNHRFYMKDIPALSAENQLELRGRILKIVGDAGAHPIRVTDYRVASIAGAIEGTAVETDVKKVNALESLSKACQFHIIPLSDYNRMMNAQETLAPGEALLYAYRLNYTADTLRFNGGNSFQIKKHLTQFVADDESAMAILPTVTLIVPTLESGLQGMEQLTNYDPTNGLAFTLNWVYNFDTDLPAEQQAAVGKTIYQNLHELLMDESVREQYQFYRVHAESQVVERDDFYGTFGSLFFLGVILSVVFILAAVLIIYYKQISEGYEDQKRFEIMQKIGMTKREIRKSINSQLLTVFFLPLIGAGFHLAFAFPMIQKLLLLFNLRNHILFLLTTVISFLVFALFYSFVYRITSNAYYGIVSGSEKRK